LCYVFSCRETNGGLDASWEVAVVVILIVVILAIIAATLYHLRRKKRWQRNNMSRAENGLGGEDFTKLRPAYEGYPGFSVERVCFYSNS
jgi:membrane protein implicated in regulation of membrane protease activity